MQPKTINFEYAVYQSKDELSEDLRILVEQAYDVIKNSYSPYSRFSVGAALRLESGIIVRGTNIENSVYPLGICAERTALFTAQAQYPNQIITDIAIAADTDKFEFETPASPCGSCRQVLVEFETKQQRDIRILLCGKHEILVVKNAHSLLPLSFNETRLMNEK